MTLSFLRCLVFFFILCPQFCEAISLGSLRDFPAGKISLSLKQERERASIEIQWGGSPADGSKGPRFKLTQSGVREATEGELSEKQLSLLFNNLQKLAQSYTVPSCRTAEASQKNHFQLYVGHQSDPLRLSFPVNEPVLWNEAVTCWMELGKNLQQSDELDWPEVTQIDLPSPEVSQPGLGAISDFTSLKFILERVHRSESNYGLLSGSWTRSKDGQIDFTVRYAPRTGDHLKATVAPSQIRPLFTQFQRIVSGYNYPSFAGKKPQALSRDYDSIDLSLSASGQPGEVNFPHFSFDSSQWSQADKLWGLAVKLFPPEVQDQIIQ